MQHIEHIYRTWIELEPVRPGSDPLPIPVFAKPSQTKLADTRLTIELNPCPERDAVLKGHRFTVGASSFNGLFEGMASQGTFTLTPQSSGYSLDEDDLKTATITAFSVPKTTDAEKIVANPVKIGTGPNSIQVMPGGKAKCSSDLYGQSIRLSVRYPSAVMISPEPVGTIRAHLVARCTDQSIRYIGLRECQGEPVGNALVLSFSPNQRLEEILVEQPTN